MAFDMNDTETLSFVAEIGNAPTISSLDVSQEVVMGHFADRDAIVTTGAKADYTVAPPMSYDA